jgi:hypothetical protein
MNDILRDKKNGIICPYIGLPSDVQTAMQNPSLQNFCHNLKPVSSPSLSHQNAFCLNVTYKQCQYFSEITGKPGAFITAKQIRVKRKWVPLAIVAILSIAILCVLLVISGQFSSLFFPPTTNKGTTPVAVATTATFETVTEPALHTVATDTIPADHVEMAESTLVIENQVQPTTGLTPIPVNTEGPLLLQQTPWAAERVFLLHRVTRGEDIIAIAGKFNTSIDAIRAVNYNMAPELWVDTMIIIPENQADVTGVAPMFPLEITGSGKTIQDLAEEHSISPDLLAAVNALPTSYRFQTGEWVIMPLAIPSPT